MFGKALAVLGVKPLIEVDVVMTKDALDGSHRGVGIRERATCKGDRTHTRRFVAVIIILRHAMDGRRTVVDELSIIRSTVKQLGKGVGDRLLAPVSVDRADHAAQTVQIDRGRIGGGREDFIAVLIELGRGAVDELITRTLAVPVPALMPLRT